MHDYWIWRCVWNRSCWKAGAQELKCSLRHGSVAPFRSCWVEIKQNCIRKGSAWESTLWNRNFYEERKKECSPKRRTNFKNANLFQSSGAQRKSSTSCCDIQKLRWKEACKAGKIKINKCTLASDISFPAEEGWNLRIGRENTHWPNSANTLEC